MTRLQRAGLDVAAEIVEFVEAEALPGTGIDADTLWQGLAGILRDLTPVNEALLAERDRLQAAIDGYHREHPGLPEAEEYRAFLTSLGYLRDAPADVSISTGRVDPEIATLAGPQLVVPLLNARFAINAANARWGSLYDALYGTDAIDEADGADRSGGYNPIRGAKVVAAGRAVLDQIAPLAHGSHADATAYTVTDGELVIALTDGGRTGLTEPAGFGGFRGTPERPTHVLLSHHGLHAEIVIDPSGVIGGTDRAGVQDIVLEAALTTIMDLEDSVAAVDAEDKALGYRNWRGLMTGTLTAELEKHGRPITRRLAADRTYTAPDGSEITLPGRSLLLIRNVGHLMRTDAVRTADGRDVPEGILDAVMTTLGSLPDLRGPDAGRNSRAGSMYIVKPKMHGPDEVAFTATLFGRVEDLLGLPPRTLKIGIMDEERRTTLNLAAAIDAASDRVVFANTGFLDRTGDEIHTSFWAGPMRPKSEMKTQRFMQAYERANVATSLAAGFGGRAQIGKGMWAMPDLMADMLEQKIAHVEAGATTAWVPSPTAATLHALHYHRLDPFTRHADILRGGPVPLDDILVPPLAGAPLGADEVQAEVDNSVQTILGYVVRWIDQGVGCSKVPDIRGVGLMEDRATLRISSQLLANWLAHGVITEAQLDDSLARLAVVVDEQNAGDPRYEPLRPDGVPGIAFQAARRIVVEGAAQPSGYTEPILHEMRRRKKHS